MVGMSSRFITAMLLPAVLLYTFFFLFPALDAFRLSLYSLSGFTARAEWVGLGNFSKAFADPLFWSSARNTLYITIVGGVFVFLLAFLFSVSLSSGIVGKRFFRAVVFLPFIISVFAVVSIWRMVYEQRWGMFNSILHTFGLASVNWTSGPRIFWAMLAAMVWTYVGFYVVLITAGINKVPKDLFEAAELQGASELQKFFHITLPLIWDVVVISLVVWIISAMKNFEFPFAFGGLNIPQDLYNTSVYMYVTGFGQKDPIFQLGYASAIGVITIAMSMIFVVIVRAGLRRDVEEM